jgi:hypothetical protein
MSPLTNIIGSNATTMVRVATTVGLPTSATASTAVVARSLSPRVCQCRTIFSTTVRTAADNIGEADIVGFDEFMLKFLGDLVQSIVVRPSGPWLQVWAPG